MALNENKKLRKAKNRRVIYLFFATFFLSLFIVGFLIKALTPNVDVEIGDGVELTESGMDDEEYQKGVDNRLKWIQFEDNMPGVSKRYENDEISDEDLNKTKSKKTEKVRENKDEIHLETTDLPKNTAKTNSLPAPVPTKSDILKPYNAPITELKMSKVYIGYYSTVEQAITVQNKILESDLNISPFIKEVSGYYVVQAGAYANRQKAQDLSNELTGMGLPVKIVSE